MFKPKSHTWRKSMLLEILNLSGGDADHEHLMNFSDFSDLSDIPKMMPTLYKPKLNELKIFTHFSKSR